MTSNFTASAARAARTIGALAAALALGLMLVQAAGAETTYITGVSMEQRQAGQRDICKLEGGTSFESTYSYTTAGTVNGITTTCHGGKNDGYTCVNTPSMTSCSKPFTRPEESPVALDQAAANGAVTTDGATVSTGTFVVATDREGQIVSTRPTAPAETPATTDQDRPIVEDEQGAEPATTEETPPRTGGEEQP
jgi:hypothetical protein